MSSTVLRHNRPTILPEKKYRAEYLVRAMQVLIDVNVEMLTELKAIHIAIKDLK